MTPIRPQFPPASPPTGPARPSSDARAAFFNAVKGAPVAQPAASPAPVASRPQLPVPAVTRVHTQAEQPAPSRLLRPGSLLDIKV